MSAKIRVKVGNIEVEYEGPGDFLEHRLSELIRDLADLHVQVGGEAGPESEPSANPTSTETIPNSNELGALATFLKDKDATSNQTRKFLAAAFWVQTKMGKKSLKTSDVTSALREAHQTRLGNASQCLNTNVSSGLCEKNGKEFFLTEEGRESLGVV